jgi:hypothetical protein
MMERQPPPKPKNATLASVSWLMPLAPSEEPEQLRQTLACLEAQSLQANELLIAADGLIPEALESVIQESSLQIRCERYPVSLGIGATLARVAPLCIGEAIVRIDSDDAYAPEHTATVVQALRHRPQCGALGCQLLEHDTDMHSQNYRRTPTDPVQIVRWLHWRNPINHQTVCLRRSALIAAGGYRHAPGFEDWDLWLRMAQLGYTLINLDCCTVSAHVNHQHRLRRRGWPYVHKEAAFFGRQIRESRIPFSIGVASFLLRVPWRLAPSSLLDWWMGSRLRGLPPIDSAWVTYFKPQGSGPPDRRQK